MTIRSQLTALRSLAIAGAVVAVLMKSFGDTVPNASEMALQHGWFAVIGNYLSTTGLVLLCVAGLAWIALSIVVFPLVKCLLGLSRTGAQFVYWIEWNSRRTEPDPQPSATSTALPDNDYMAPLIGEFMQPDVSLRDNICLLAQIMAFPITIALLALGQSLYRWLF